MATKKAAQLNLDLKKRGGKRPGAGRPNRSGARGHTARPELSGREPLHVTIKLRDGLPSLRREDVFVALQEAVKKAREKGLRLVHYAILSNHAHFIVEAQDRPSLTRGLQSLGVSLARQLNKLSGEKGSAFKGRYHLHVLKTPREVKHALRYVLTNEAKHRALTVQGLDVYSSAALFVDKARLLEGVRLVIPSAEALKRLQVALQELCTPATTWLLRIGWTKS